MAARHDDDVRIAEPDLAGQAGLTVSQRSPQIEHRGRQLPMVVAAKHTIRRSLPPIFHPPARAIACTTVVGASNLLQPSCVRWV